MQIICNHTNLIGLLLVLSCDFPSRLKSKFHLLRHDTTRHDTTRYQAHSFWHNKKSRRAVSIMSGSTARTTRSSRQARLARHAFRGVAIAWTGLDMLTPLFPDVVNEIDANLENKRLNLYVRASCVSYRVVTCRNVTQQVELGL